MKENAIERLKAASLTEDLGFLLSRARTLWVARDTVAFAEFGLRGRSYSILSLAASGVNPTQRELADFLKLDASQIVALVDELEKAGYVERRSSPTDRRTNIIVATPKGERAHAQAREAANAAEQASDLDLSEHERATLLELLRRLAF